MCLKVYHMNIALRRFLHNHGNIATEGSPKPGLCPTLMPYPTHYREAHGAMVRAWRFADVESRLVQGFQRNIMFLPSQYWDIVSMLCPWARHSTLKCFT